MIKAKNGKSVLKGNVLELMNEYNAITEVMVQMLKDKGMPNKTIKNILTDTVENNFLTQEEIQQKLFKKLAELKTKLFGDEEKEGGADNE